MDPYAWAWDLEALVLVPALAIAYALVVQTTPTPRWRMVCFAAGLGLILVVSITPIQTIALNYLLSAHLLQNVALAEWAPALCVLGLPPALAAALGGLPLARQLTRPPVALAVWLAVYFAWHVPFAYDAALRHQATLLHLEHASYFAAGCLVWWPVFQGHPWQLSDGGRAAYLFAAFVLASPLGLLLALIPEPVYDFYENGPGLWGLSALTDQQIAGVSMAFEQAAVFFAASTFFFLRFLTGEETGEAFRDLHNPSTPAYNRGRRR